MRFTRPFIIVVALLLVFLSAYSLTRSKDEGVFIYAENIRYDDAELIINESASLNIAFARTPKERSQGLSRQENILENQGLLFQFSDEGLHSIWMRDMYFAIDILWLDNEFTVVDIKKNATPKSFRTEFDYEAFSPRVPALYVLEVQQGFVDAHSVRTGDTFLIKENN